METPVGQTKDHGFQAGARKTFKSEQKKVWDKIFSAEGLSIWLGEIQSESLQVRKAYQTGGIEFEITLFKPYSHTRMVWKREEWDNHSILQLRVIPNQGKTTISFHQEKLLDVNQREQMKRYWQNILKELVDFLKYE